MFPPDPQLRCLLLGSCTAYAAPTARYKWPLNGRNVTHSCATETARVKWGEPTQDGSIEVRTNCRKPAVREKVSPENELKKETEEAGCVRPSAVDKGADVPIMDVQAQDTKAPHRLARIPFSACYINVHLPPNMPHT